MRFSLKSLLGLIFVGLVGSTPVHAGIVVNTAIVTPVEDPHYHVFFDIVIQANTKLEVGDSITIGPAPYIDPITGANLQYLITPFDGIWGGRFASSVLPSPQKNYFKFTYIDPTPYNNTTGGPVSISTNSLGLEFGIFTIDMGPLTPTLALQLTQTLTTTSVTTDPSSGQKVITNGTVKPTFATPEPSTLVMLATLVPVAAWAGIRRRRTA